MFVVLAAVNPTRNQQYMGMNSFPNNAKMCVIAAMFKMGHPIREAQFNSGWRWR